MSIKNKIQHIYHITLMQKIIALALFMLLFLLLFKPIFLYAAETVNTVSSTSGTTTYVNGYYTFTYYI